MTPGQWVRAGQAGRRSPGGGRLDISMRRVAIDESNLGRSSNGEAESRNELVRSPERSDGGLSLPPPATAKAKTKAFGRKSTPIEKHQQGGHGHARSMAAEVARTPRQSRARAAPAGRARQVAQAVQGAQLDSDEEPLPPRQGLNRGACPISRAQPSAKHAATIDGARWSSAPRGSEIIAASFRHVDSDDDGGGTAASFAPSPLSVIRRDSGSDNDSEDSTGGGGSGGGGSHVSVSPGSGSIISARSASTHESAGSRSVARSAERSSARYTTGGSSSDTELEIPTLRPTLRLKVQSQRSQRHILQGSTMYCHCHVSRPQPPTD